MNRREIAEQIFIAGVKSVVPDALIAGTVWCVDNKLHINDLIFDLRKIERIFVTGAGKASALMAAELEKILGSRITEGHIIVKYGHSTGLNRIRVTEAGHPYPDENGLNATKEIMNLARKAGSNDLVICLLSGGGSSLLWDCPEGCTTTELMEVSRLLVNSGASIHEINAVRKHLSEIKGGRLARLAHPAKTVSLILSDVIGDPPDVIASGPTAPDPTTFVDAIEVIDNYNLKPLIPGKIYDYLYSGATGKLKESPKPGDKIFRDTHNIIIGSNRIALENARTKALEYNLNAIVVEDQLQGDVVTVSEFLVDAAMKYEDDPNETKPVCILFGGETTVKMTGKGEGGRNQHLALLCARLLEDKPGITILCGGTDGSDGPTKAAGAVVDSETILSAYSKDIDHGQYIREFNSYNFFRKVSGHIITGPTMTNVMDIVVLIVD
jgi:glycerate-2-kinase